MAIPKYPEFKELELGDREEVEAALKNCRPETSDCSFANLYFWRQYDRPKLTRINENVCVLLSPVDSIPYFLLPIGGNRYEGALAACFAHLKKLPQLRMVPERIAKKYFEKKLEYCFELDHDNSDYIYKTADLIALKGRKYDAKRNWIKRFLAKNVPQYIELTSDRLPQALELLGRWAKDRAGAIIKYEVLAIKEALSNIESLGTVARGILVNGQLEAFMIGGELNPEMAVVYIQVANRELPGIPQYFHQVFTAAELKKYKYVNWEQDLGIPGLRKAKLSYHPHKIAYKYNVSRL